MSQFRRQTEKHCGTDHDVVADTVHEVGGDVAAVFVEPHGALVLVTSVHQHRVVVHRPQLLHLKHRHDLTPLLNKASELSFFFPVILHLKHRHDLNKVSELSFFLSSCT